MTRSRVKNDFSVGIDDGADAKAITIDSNERVLIGTDSGDAFNSNSLLRVQQASAVAYIQVKTDNNQTGGLLFGDTDDDFRGGFFYENATDQLAVYTGDAERLRVTANGLTFNGDTASANALDDYEEGTWTPVLIGNGGTNPTVSYGNQTGYYTKVGNVVTVSWYSGTLNISNAGSGYAYISGLPYSSSTAAHHYPVCKVTFNTSTTNACDGGYLYDGTMRLMQSGLSSTLTTWTSGSSQYLMIGAVYRTA